MSKLGSAAFAAALWQCQQCSHTVDTRARSHRGLGRWMLGGLGGGDRPTTVMSSKDSIWYWETLTSTRQVASGRPNAQGATVRVPHAPQRRSACRLSRSHWTIRTSEESPIERVHCLPNETRLVGCSGDGLVEIWGGDLILEDIGWESAAKIGEGEWQNLRILVQRQCG